jgi:hypothetical protein
MHIMHTLGLVEPVWFMVLYNSFEMYVFPCWTSGHIGLCLGEGC